MEIGSVNWNQPAPSATPQASPQVKEEDRRLIQAVRALNAVELFGENRELTFVLDQETRRPIVRIVDRETGEVLRQIPPEYLLHLADELRD